ncbi:MAG: pyrimidine-nucleoside phosphorylase [Ruminococcaceae bacterium]|nr:pyrimidine-nucleoside phosphorylase [Oscillospiraceae bacterium]
MRMYDIIRKKRDGGLLSDAEIQWFIDGYVKGEIPDYQASALCMAIYFRGMSIEETTALTFAIRDSGDRLDFSGIDGLRVDKHSTGGVGDKTSLVVTPIVASLGVKVAKMSGRGLGHTGGTVDKLEAIPGFRTDIPTAEFEQIVNDVGIAIVGQNATLAPADKLLYALRDVTATVDSLPLIVSSIMGKKLAADDDCIVLDVKTGSGAFMKTVEDSRRLAEAMVEIGKRAGKKMCALITDMDRPLGFAIGNSLEVIEAVETLKGNGPRDLTELCIALASRMLHLAEKGTYEECEIMVREAINSGKALDTFAKMVYAQGGDGDWILHPEKFPSAKYSYEVKAERDGYIVSVDTEGYGVASLLLGAGRNTKEDVIDSAAGIMLKAKTGDLVKRGDTLAVMYSEREECFASASARFLEATRMGDVAPEAMPLILDTVE